MTSRRKQTKPTKSECADSAMKSDIEPSTSKLVIVSECNNLSSPVSERTKMDPLVSPALLSTNFYYAYKYFEWQNKLEEHMHATIPPKHVTNHGWDTVDGSSMVPINLGPFELKKPTKNQDDQTTVNSQHPSPPNFLVHPLPNPLTDVALVTDDGSHSHSASTPTTSNTMDSSSCLPTGVTTTISPNARNDSLDSSHHQNGPVPLQFSSPAPARLITTGPVTDTFQPPASNAGSVWSTGPVWWTKIDKCEEREPTDLSVPVASRQPTELEEPQLGESHSDSELNLSSESMKRKQREDIKIQPYALRGSVEVFQCPLCSKSEIFSRGQLTHHLQEHQSSFKREDYKHVCCFCFSELSSNSSLERHLLTHTNHRPFNCTFCDKAFTTNGNLSRHIRTSHQVKSDALISSLDSHGSNQTNWFLQTAYESTQDSLRKEPSLSVLLQSKQGLGKATIEEHVSVISNSIDRHHLPVCFDASAVAPSKENEMKSRSVLSCKVPPGDNGLAGGQEPQGLSPMLTENGQSAELESLPQQSIVNNHHGPHIGSYIHSGQLDQTMVPSSNSIQPLVPIDKSWFSSNLLNWASIRLQNNNTLFQLMLERNVQAETIQSSQSSTTLFHHGLLTALWPQMANSIPVSHSATPLVLTSEKESSLTSTPVKSGDEQRPDGFHDSKHISSASSSTGLWMSMDSDRTDSSRTDSQSNRCESNHAFTENPTSTERGDLKPSQSNVEVITSPLSKVTREKRQTKYTRVRVLIPTWYSPKASKLRQRHGAAFQTKPQLLVKIRAKFSRRCIPKCSKRRMNPMQPQTTFPVNRETSRPELPLKTSPEHPINLPMPRQITDQNPAEILDLSIPKTKKNYVTPCSLAADPFAALTINPYSTFPVSSTPAITSPINNVVSSPDLGYNTLCQKVANNGKPNPIPFPLLINTSPMKVAQSLGEATVQTMSQPMDALPVSGSASLNPSIVTVLKSTNTTTTISNVAQALPIPLLPGLQFPYVHKKNSYKDAPKLITCPIPGCSQKFPWNSSLKRHILTHTPHKPFACTRCTKSFSTKSNRERHMERVHQVSLKRQRQRVQCVLGSDGQRNDSGGDTRSLTSTGASDNASNFPEATEELREDELISMSSNEKQAEDISNTLLTRAGDPVVEPNPERLYTAALLAATAAAAAAAANPGSATVSSAHPYLSVSRDYLLHQTQWPRGMRKNRRHTRAKLTELDWDKANRLVLPTSSTETSETAIDLSIQSTSTETPTVRCPICGATVTTKSLRRHLNHHQLDTVVFRCHLCQLSFNDRVVTLKHWSVRHPEEWSKFLNKLRASGGPVEALVASIEKVPCPKDDPETMTGDSTKTNLLDVRHVTCCICLHRFGSQQDLQRHMRSHTGERPFICPDCGKEFSLKHSMHRHYRVHMKQGPVNPIVQTPPSNGISDLQSLR